MFQGFVWWINKIIGIVASVWNSSQKVWEIHNKFDDHGARERALGTKSVRLKVGKKKKESIFLVLDLQQSRPSEIQTLHNIVKVMSFKND